MSTTSDIVDGISRLIKALDELFTTQTVDALVELVRQLGIGEPVKQGLRALGTALDELVEWITRLEQVAAVPKMLEALDPTLAQVEGLASTSADELRQAGLDELIPMTDAARTMRDVMKRIREGAESVLRGLLPDEALGRLRQSVQHFADTLKSYEERLATEPAKKALSTGKAQPALVGAST